MVQQFKRLFSFITNHPLSKRKPISAIIRIIIWQIQSSICKKLIVKTFAGKVLFYAKKGLHGITGNIYAGLHEFNDMGFLLHFLRTEDKFCDIGANVGAYTLLASGYIGAKSIAFEPVPSTFSILEKNILLNQLQKKVTLHNKALGNQNGEMKFTVDYDTVNHAIAENEFEKNSINVKMEQLDNFIDYEPILLKIDVEGFEREVIEGGKELLDRETTKAIIIELNGSGERYNFRDQDIHHYLKTVGFAPYLYDPFTRIFTEIEYFGKHNTIYIKDINFAKIRCERALKVKVLGVEF